MRILEGLAAEGKIVLITSSEPPLCDRMVVFFEGQIVGSTGGSCLPKRALLEALNAGSLGSG